MATGTLGEAAGAMAARLLGGDAAAPWSGARLDSRQVTGAELFFALPGEHVDGHDYAVPALAAGASAVVVSRDVPDAAGARLVVPDVFEGLHTLTREVRRRVPRHLVAITGSNGKTTTKELLAVLLARRFDVARSPGNLNNLLGVPLSLLNIPDTTEWMVAEMGMSVPGELGRMSRLGLPDVAVFTNVRPVHLEGLGSIEAVAHAKAELLEGLPADGVVVANADDPWVRWIADRHPGPTVWYGIEEAADLRAAEVAAVEGGAGTRFRLVAGGDAIDVALPLHGRYNVENFLAAAATARHLGVPLDDIAAAAGDLRPVAGRGEVHRLAGGVTVIDDSYNSNPVALRKALESAAALPAERRWAVLGDMLELGEEERRYHREEGEAAAGLGFAPLVGVGELSRDLVAAARAAGAEAHWVASAEEAAAWAVERLRDGDLVVVKGSRGVHLEKVVAALRAARRGGEG